MDGLAGAVEGVTPSSRPGPDGSGRAPPSGTEGQDPLRLPVLVLNRFFQPVQLTPARRAFALLYGGSASAVDETGEFHDFAKWRTLPVRTSDDALPIVGGALRVPRVLHLGRYASMRRPPLRLTRRNLMLRDGHQCQYCGQKLPARDLNIDHVMPRSRGGASSWQNLVTACRPCNLKKGHRTPEEAGMALLSRPGPPRWSTTKRLLLGSSRAFEEWEPYLRAG